MDTGWNNLSPDNVTALIGQNESGKTSVLEALRSFYDGIISDDMLRSDMSMPEVSCTFQFEKDSEFPAPDKLFPEGVLGKIQEDGCVTLTRTWNDLQSSKLELNGEDIISMYGGFDNYWDKLDSVAQETFVNKTQSKKELTDEVDSLEQLLAKYRLSIENLMSKSGEIERQQKKHLDEKRKDLLDRENAQIAKEVAKLEQQVEKTTNEITTIREEIDSTKTVLEVSAKCKDIKITLERELQRVDQAYEQMGAEEKALENARSSREQRNSLKKLEQHKNLYIEATSKYEQLKRDLKLLQLELKYLLDGKDEFEARHLAEKDFNQLDKICSREEAAFLFFENIPHFELFEDFSSLLPNKIDLDDLFLEHTNAEGYKAVKNFLVIAGLDPQFFTQTNNRILKQKIENLNNELTVNFQDFWGQCIGKTNKIQIAFELEHYDFQNPEKMGRPYLEFWIKDEHERLYPKQRSRGVRWFLSFYLELKASASRNGGKNRVLLIDEPAMSLHARAQEDVLKVFDDIKSRLQVVYSTHSPNLIDPSKIYRVLAVQRSHEEHNSETVIFDASSLHSAAHDTLSPVYSLMGVRLSEDQFIRKKNNVLVEDTVTFYYLSSILPLMGLKKEISFIPATGGQSLPLLANLMLGWGLDYSIVLFEKQGNSSYDEDVKASLHAAGVEMNNRIIQIESIPTVEDLFSTLDFKKHILKQRVGITQANSEYIQENSISRILLASSFAQLVKDSQLKISDFDEETQDKVKKLVRKLDETLS